MSIVEKSAAEIWDIAARYLRGKVSTGPYEQYFAGMVPVRLDEHCLVLGVSNDFFADWVEEGYAALINESLSNIDGIDYTHSFESGYQPVEVEKVPEEAVAAAPVPLQENTFLPRTNRNWQSGSVQKTPERTGTPVNSIYTFENFVVGEENRYAFAAAKRATECPGLFNPLYIYGNTGIGKTHLLQAVAHETRRKYPDMVVRYATCEEILNSFVASLNSHQYGEFRSQLRDVDMLLVDDIHVLGGKGQLQEQFFNAFNTLYAEGKQIVLTSDKRPSEIAGLEARLISRFEQGVTTEIYAPGLEIRIAILRGMQQSFMMRFEDEVLEFIASRISSNVRRLRGALMQLLTRVSLDPDMPVTLQRVESILHSVFEEEFTSQQITVDEIQKKVAEYFNLRISDLLSNKRPKSIAEPRMVAMYLARKLTDSSFPQIGDAFARNHATIINAWTKVPELCAKDEDLRRAVAVLERQLKA